jgi:hypothetical protein
VSAKQRRTRRARYSDKLVITWNDDYTLPEVPHALFSKNKCEQWRRETFRQDRQPKAGLIPLIANGRNSPFTIVPVIDCLMRLKGLETYIAASALVEVLEEEYPYIAWDQITVGRILSSLAETSEALHLQPTDEYPLQHTIWSGKRVYYLHHTVRGHQWWGACRDVLAAEARKQNEAVRAGGEYDTGPTIWTSIELIELGGVSPE